MSDIIIFLIVMTVIFLSYAFGYIMGFAKGSKKKKKKSKYPKCDCSDVNECSKWCYAKQAFNKDFQDGKI